MPTHRAQNIVLDSEAILGFRADLGLTRVQLAELAGLSAAGVWKIETGRVQDRGSSISTARAIAGALRVDLEQIVKRQV